MTARYSLYNYTINELLSLMSNWAGNTKSVVFSLWLDYRDSPLFSHHCLLSSTDILRSLQHTFPQITKMLKIKVIFYIPGTYSTVYIYIYMKMIFVKLKRQKHTYEQCNLMVQRWKFIDKYECIHMCIHTIIIQSN